MKLVKAESEADFDSTMLFAMFKLQNQIPQNGKLEAKLSDFEIPHGNACSEQNNWSVISHLNSGLAKGGNTYCEHPLQLIKDLIQRYERRMAKSNQLLFGMCQKMIVELGHLKNEPNTTLTQDVIKAASVLCLFFR